MASTTTPAALRRQIQKLLDDREKHAQAVRLIDATLEDVQKLLAPQEFGSAQRSNGNGHGERLARRRRQSGRKRGRFEFSGEQSILRFVKRRHRPTTGEINKFWRSEGRKGTADNSLSKLVREKQLKRAPAPGERGSRYQLV